MENKKQGYKVRKYQGPVKRYCQMLNLKNDAALIAEYRKRHSEGKVWPETLAAIREVGILEMEIYILGTNLFMIVETPLDFDWDTAMARMATLPRQAEWEEYMDADDQQAFSADVPLPPGICQGRGKLQTPDRRAPRDLRGDPRPRQTDWSRGDQKPY